MTDMTLARALAILDLDRPRLPTKATADQDLRVWKDTILKDAWRTKAKATHPDREGGNEEAFKQAQTAYAFLSQIKVRTKPPESGRAAGLDAPPTAADVDEDLPPGWEETQTHLQAMFESFLANLLARQLRGLRSKARREEGARRATGAPGCSPSDRAPTDRAAPPPPPRHVMDTLADVFRELFGDEEGTAITVIIERTIDASESMMHVPPAPISMFHPRSSFNVSQVVPFGSSPGLPPPSPFDAPSSFWNVRLRQQQRRAQDRARVAQQRLDEAEVRIRTVKEPVFIGRLPRGWNGGGRGGRGRR